MSGTKIELTEQEKAQLQELAKLMCSCEDQEKAFDTARHVENHLGVRHGWVCLTCNLFVQIG